MKKTDISKIAGQKEESPIFEVELGFLEHIKKTMLPHQKEFNIIQFFELIIDYSMKLPNQTFEAGLIQEINESALNYVSREEGLSNEAQLPQLSPRKRISVNKVNSSNLAAEVKQRKIKYAEEILDKLKNVFLWYRKKTVSYEMINNYVLSCQNRTLKDKNALQNLTEYQNLPHRRVRLDQNVKLCIMPQGDSSKIKSLSINPLEENNEDVFRKDFFVVTSEYIRGIRVDSDKLAKEGNKTIKVKETESNESTSKISIVKNWYTYNQEKIMPQSREQNEKSMKINAKKQLYIEKVAISEHLIGIVTHQKDVLIKPFLGENQKYQRGRRVVPYQIKLGSLVQDIPDQNLQRPISQDKAKAEELEKGKLLMFECYNDDIWIAVNEQFVYVYILPLPDSNQLVNDEEPKSSMLALCEPLPSRGCQAKLLTKQYLAIMLQTPCVVILKLQLSSKSELRQKNRIYPTNKIYNDIKFICMDYHPVDRQLVFTDFGSYLIRLRFNIADGDVEREGAVYDEDMGKLLTENTTNTRRDKKFSALKKQSQINIQTSLQSHFSQVEIERMALQESKRQLSQKTKKDSLTIWQNQGTSISNISLGGEIHLSKHKSAAEKLSKHDKGGMSIYSKPQNTDYMKIVKNSSRQNMILLCLNKNTSTLITYEEMSVNPLKNGKQDEESDKDRLYDKTIKLWDMNHMNVYQTFTLSLQIADLSLQSNGLYFVTKERGYLGFYPLLNKEQNSEVQKKQKNALLPEINKQVKPVINDKIIISGNEIFFYTQLQKQRNLHKIERQGYQNHLVNYNNPVTTVYNLSISNQQHSIVNLQEIPAEIAQLQVRDKLYVLSDTSGDKKFNLHIYDMLGNKEAILKGTDRTVKYGILENYTNLRKIKHFQFNVLLWNKHSLKFVGSNLEESFTVHWTFNCLERSAHKSTGSEFDLRSLKSSVSRRQREIEEICICQNSISIQEKLQNELYRVVTLSVLHLDSGRIKYRVNDIRSSFNVLQMVNNMILARQSVYTRSMTSNQAEEIETSRKSSFNRLLRHQNRSSVSYPVNQDQEFINLFDLNSPFYRKCLLTIKYRTLVEESMSLEEIQQYEMEFNKVIAHERFFTQKSIVLKSARLFALNNDNSIIVSCIFMVKSQSLFKKSNSQTSIQKDRVFNSNSKYLLYTREISSEVAEKMKYIPHTTDANVKKVSKKAMSEYMGQTEVHQRILTHWEIDSEELVSRSTIKNFSYLGDLHCDNDQGMQFIVEDITEKLINFSEDDHKHKRILSPYQKIHKIYETNFSHESNSQIDIMWLLAQAQSPKSIIKLSSPKFFELHSQEISFNPAHKKVSVKLEKICHVALDQATQKPFVKEWNEAFNCQNKQVWEETKSSMIEYIKQKMSKENQKQLDSPSNISKKNSKLSEKQTNLLALTETEQAPSQNNKQQISSPEKHQSKSDFNSNQLNNMFRQWHINKNIQKEMKEYENNTNEAQKQLNKELKHIIDNPEIKQKRIQYLLEFPQKIKDHRLGNAMELISKSLNFQNSMNKIFSMINLTTSQKVTKQVKQVQRNKRKSDDYSLEKRVQNSLQQLQMSLSLPKIGFSDHKNTKSVFGSSKMSELKCTKKSSQNQIDPRIHSSLSSEANELSSSLKTGNRSQSLKTTKNLPMTRTKTETSERNYLQLITETPLELSQNSKKDRQNEKLRKLHSPNPESSLSNIHVVNPQNRESPSGSYNLSNIIMNSPFSPNLNTVQAKKSKSILTRTKTQASHSQQQTLSNASNNALIQLKQSSITINKSILPQIKMNREKLNQKMKEKKSFLKAVNQRLCFTKEEIKEQLLRKQKKPEKLQTLQ